MYIATLSFFLEPQKLIVMKDHTNLDVELNSQRCGESFVQTVGCEFYYIPLANLANLAQIDVLPEIYESIEFSEIDLFGTIEDELILSLLIVPMHSS